jgi:hypothetical protein
MTVPVLYYVIRRNRLAAEASSRATLSAEI